MWYLGKIQKARTGNRNAQEIEGFDSSLIIPVLVRKIVKVIYKFCNLQFIIVIFFSETFSDTIFMQVT